jgi:hypothetical protein
VVHERFGTETVVVNLDSGVYYSLDGVGDTIWALAVAQCPESEIIGRLVATTEGDSALVAEAITGFFDDLIAEALLDATPCAEPIAPAATETGAAAVAFIAPTLRKYTDMEELLQLDPIHEVDEVGWPSARVPPHGGR